MDHPDFSFEIKHKDIGGRVGVLRLNGKEVETPTIMPVYNLNDPIIPIEVLKEEFGIDILMSNAYILMKNENLREKALNIGIHKLLDFDGLIATDSGSYQMMVYGSVATTNKQIVEFQNKIGSDIASFLDIPTLPDTFKPRAQEQLDETLNRAYEAKKHARFLVNAGIQGGNYLDLRKKSAMRMGKEFHMVAIGGIVRLMENYRFTELIDIIGTVKQCIPSNKVVHAFGLGHPMVFAIATGMGCDLFDSAAYALYAKDGRYLTENSTEKIKEMKYLPCSCPVCSSHKPEEMDTVSLAKHNLYVTLEEINRVKQAIIDGSLWELIQIRARAHPALFNGFLRMVKGYGRFLSKLDPITKKSAFFYGGPESRYRSEVINCRKRIGNVSSDKSMYVKVFGKVPTELLDIYPINSVIDEMKEYVDISVGRVSDMEKINAIMEYQFGPGAKDVIPENIRIIRSRKSGRIRYIYSKEKELLGVMRAHDHFIIPKMHLAKKLHERFSYPKNRVVINDEAIPFVTEGKSVFARFIVDIDKDLRSGDEVLIVDTRDNLIRTGKLLLSPIECIDFDKGAAVNVR